MGISNHAKNFVPPSAHVAGKRNLIGLSYDELSDALTTRGFEPFRAKQVWSWIYCHGVSDFSKMTTLAKPAREKLEEHFIVARPTISQDQKSEDGTRKWLLRMVDGQEVECVHIPESDRGALCVSSQVGCTLTCRFCHTGTQKLVRNLEASEIVMQVLLARDALGEWPSTKDERLLSNIVMMGMGEPLFNYENVAKALRIIMHGEGIAISKRKITLSTAGVVPMMKRCGEELDVNLAVSLHAVTDELRDQIVPINRKYPIKELLQACRDYPGASNSRRITFEYVMLKGVNDIPADAKQLVRLLRGIPSKINLIPFNAWPGAPFECSDWDVIEKFGDMVNAAGYPSPIRMPRGRDIMAACGQLKSQSIRLSAAERAAIDKILAEKDQAEGLAG
ncbi:MAG: 23S rRNA (adenine(2503)-C(2))-methyltransferase RlmN [Alphaproteobacteria bacterium]|nr:23S rRNA (adenine(2503)-C(2))-methyltransferase RlmN [Alphaproteobacteria bacterium]